MRERDAGQRPGVAGRQPRIGPVGGRQRRIGRDAYKRVERIVVAGDPREARLGQRPGSSTEPSLSAAAIAVIVCRSTLPAPPGAYSMTFGTR